MGKCKRLCRNLDYLKVLCKTNKRQRESILHGADRDLILCLCECADNVLKGNVPLKETQHERLRNYKKPLRCMANKNVSVQTKKKLLVQEGGFLPLLLTPILSIAGSLIADAIAGR